MNRKWNIDDEVNKKCIDEVITRIEEMDGENVGIIAAQDIIDIVAEYLGPEVYNAGIRSTKKLLQERFHDLEIDVDLLEQS
jgi:uncharacterized protein (DUF2164 family)